MSMFKASRAAVVNAISLVAGLSKYWSTTYADTTKPGATTPNVSIPNAIVLPWDIASMALATADIWEMYFTTTVKAN
eukprot:CAMPEP_0197666630 /NCGR_PEP_ID=MMETSP1338-20131121/63267_1 /TAXON_ID=43686 ORGANISM="Pelagodinium beii, Strain RCC1491" /NCGR_SAMPLE_ID=MMETSP1338 /ASSEMBLY_ACC=CAM_ASM_000754 /LENGTH=76 /DNA_ID=CAMNT_0043245693 /DNA_START=253 /DNA_END=480 /DNA_ORIENTATION=-